MTFAIAYRRCVLLLVPALLLLPGPADAQEDEETETRSRAFYISLHGGWGIMHDSEFSRFTTAYTVEPDAVAIFDSGVTGGAAIGFRSDKDWRVEFEVTYRTNAFDEIQWNRFAKFGNFPTSGKMETMSYMVNYIGEIPEAEGFSVYLGVGAGIANFRMTNVADAEGPLFTGTDTSFAFQFLAGVEFPLTDHFALSISYKIFASLLANHADLAQPGIGGDRTLQPVSASSFLLGMAFYF